MMNNFKIFGFLSFFLLTISCDEFLEVEPKGEIAETFFNSPEDYDKALIGAYDLLQATFWGTQTAVIASPDIVAGGDRLNYDQPTLQDVDKMKHTQSTYVQIRDIWQLAYAELFFLKKLWPDFNHRDLQNIIKKFKEAHIFSN